MNLECPECGSADIDIAPFPANNGTFECRECGHQFDEEDLDA